MWKGGVVIGPVYSGMIAGPNNGLIVEGNSGLGVTSMKNKLDIDGSVAIGYVTNSLATVTAPTNGLLVEGNFGLGNYNTTE